MIITSTPIPGRQWNVHGGDPEEYVYWEDDDQFFAAQWSYGTQLTMRATNRAAAEAEVAAINARLIATWPETSSSWPIPSLSLVGDRSPIT